MNNHYFRKNKAATQVENTVDSQKEFEALLRPADVSEILGVTVQTLAVWRCTGRQCLSYIKVGSKVLYRKSDVYGFLQSNLIVSSAQAIAC